MDNTELHYVSFDPEQIWDEMQDAYLSAGGDVLYPGDEKEMLLRAAQSEIVRHLAEVDNGLRMATLRYAVGEYLDIYGEKRGCARIQAAAARASVRIEFAATGAAGTIPEGTALTADGARAYLLAADVAYTGFAQTLEAEIVCAEAGRAGNGLAAGTQMQFVVSQPAVRSVFVTEGALGGMETEDDESYRARIQQWGLGNVTTGPSERYESEARSASSEIIDCRALRTEPGKVCIYLLLREGAELDSVRASVLAAASPRDVRPLTDDVSAEESAKVPYRLHVTCEMEASSGDASQAVTDAVGEYRAWQDETIGRAFNPYRLVAALYQAGAARVTIEEDSNFNGGAAEYTEIAGGAHCAGEIEMAVK